MSCRQATSNLQKKRRYEVNRFACRAADQIRLCNPQLPVQGNLPSLGWPAVDFVAVGVAGCHSLSSTPPPASCGKLPIGAACSMLQPDAVGRGTQPTKQQTAPSPVLSSTTSHLNFTTKPPPFASQPSIYFCATSIHPRNDADNNS